MYQVIKKNHSTFLFLQFKTGEISNKLARIKVPNNNFTINTTGRELGDMVAATFVNANFTSKNE
jgi:hypothetical protein